MVGNALSVKLMLATQSDRLRSFYFLQADTAHFWKEITRRTENRLNAFIGECTIETRKILYSAGRGDPELREHRLYKYVLPKWNSKISPLGRMSLDLPNAKVNFEPNIEFFKIATLLDQ